MTQATQQIMHDAASASGNGTAINVNGMSVAILEISGSFTASIAFQALVRDSWVAISATNVATGASSTTASAAGAYRLNIAGFTQLRAVLTWTSGTSITILGHAINMGSVNSGDGIFATSVGGAGDTVATSDTGSFSLIALIKRLLTKQDSGTSAKVAITRPADATPYTAGDVVGDVGGSAIFSLANMTYSSGGEIIITSVELQINVSSVSSGMTGFYLRLYNSSPTAIADNASWDLVSGDRSKYLGRIPLGVPVDEGSTLFIDNDSLNKQITLTSGTLYVELQTITGYTPTSSAVYTLTVHATKV